MQDLPIQEIKNIVAVGKNWWRMLLRYSLVLYPRTLYGKFWIQTEKIQLIRKEGPPRQGSMNDLLSKKDVYGPLIRNQITSWANLGNDAAHAQYDIS